MYNTLFQLDISYDNCKSTLLIYAVSNDDSYHLNGDTSINHLYC